MGVTFPVESETTEKIAQPVQIIEEALTPLVINDDIVVLAESPEWRMRHCVLEPLGNFLLEVQMQAAVIGFKYREFVHAIHRTPDPGVELSDVCFRSGF
jgi:hypothetical protein